MGKTKRKSDQDPAPKPPINWNALLPLGALFTLMIVIQVNEGADAIPQPAWGAVGVIIGYLVGGAKD